MEMYSKDTGDNRQLETGADKQVFVFYYHERWNVGVVRS